MYDRHTKGDHLLIRGLSKFKPHKLNSPAVMVVVGSCVVVVVTCSVVVVVGSGIDYCKFDNEQLCINA